MDALVKIFSALSDPARLEILKILEARKSCCVCELTDVLGLSQPNISHHMRVLKEAGLIDGEKDGLWINYRLASCGDDTGGYVRPVLKFISGLLNDDPEISRRIKKLRRISRRKSSIMCKGR